MSRRSRRRSRSRSRDSWRRSYARSSYDSYSRSRSISRSRRGSSRDRKSVSRSRLRSSDYRNTSTFSRDRKRHSESRNSAPSRGGGGGGGSGSGSTSSQWKQPTESHPNVNQQGRFSGYRGRRPPVRQGVWRGSNKYESEEFKSQRLQKMEEFKQHRNTFNLEKQKQQKQLADLTTQLNNLVAQLALLPKEAPERTDIGQQIQEVKFTMKQLQANQIPKPNKIDNRETKLLFKQLPECAKGPGKLAEWIASNAAVLLPKQIAMLASTGEGAVIQYHSHKIADTVMNSCKLHGIAVCWAPAPAASSDNDAVDTTSDDVDYTLL